MPTPTAQTLHKLRRKVERLPAHQRLSRIEHHGRAYRVKRPERLLLRWRLQKGDPRRALERERAAYHALDTEGRAVSVLRLLNSLS